MKADDFRCRAPAVLNVTFNPNDLRLLCTAEGDPAPEIAWSSDSSNESLRQAPASDSGGHFKRSHFVLATQPGNYTCTARNVAGNVTSLFVVNQTLTKVVRPSPELGKIRILESPAGFTVTCLLLVILGCLLRVT